jgi:hypothetical protein
MLRTNLLLAIAATVTACVTNNTYYYGGPPDTGTSDVSVADVSNDLADTTPPPVDVPMPQDTPTPPLDVVDTGGPPNYGSCGMGVHTCECRCASADANVDACQQHCFDVNMACSMCLQDWATQCIGAHCSSQQDAFVTCVTMNGCATITGMIDMTCANAHCRMSLDALNGCVNAYTSGPMMVPECHDSYVACLGTVDLVCP